MKAPQVKQFVLNRYRERWPDKTRAIPGFHGYLVVIHPSPWKTSFDAPGCSASCPAGAVVLSAADGNRVLAIRPWRYKKQGKEYGAKWVALRDNNGNKKHFKLEKLALELFGDKWLELKKEIEALASQNVLEELF